MKPRSALNSSAFDSVIKRYRQRQQQQTLAAQRRQQRAKQRKSPDEQLSVGSMSSSNPPSSEKAKLQGQAVSRSHRYSSTDNQLGMSSVLDSSIWRKEKICCGIIFRGLYNEVAIVPRLLKPCHCRLDTLRKAGRGRQDNLLNSDESTENDHELINEADEDDDVHDPPSRTIKSGSISSCDSNTSGCGSLEEITANCKSNSTRGGKRTQNPPSSVVLNKRSRLQNSSRDITDESTGKSLSDNSSGYYNNLDDDGMALGSEMVLSDGAPTSEASNDTSSLSVDSLTSSDIVERGPNALDIC